MFPSFGEPVLTFDRITYYNGYRDRDLLTPEQIEILREEGPMGCIGFRSALLLLQNLQDLVEPVRDRQKGVCGAALRSRLLLLGHPHQLVVAEILVRIENDITVSMNGAGIDRCDGLTGIPGVRRTCRSIPPGAAWGPRKRTGPPVR